MKKLILCIAIIISSIAFVNPINAQNHSEYVTVRLVQHTSYGKIWITHPNGKLEEIEISSARMMNGSLSMEEREPKLMQVFNRLLDKGYNMIHVGGNGEMPVYEIYVFAK